MRLVGRVADPRVRQVIAGNLRRLGGWDARDGASVNALAEQLGMDASQLSGYAGGHRGFSIETLLRMAVGLKCSLDDLVRGVDPEYSRAATSRRYPTVPDDLVFLVDHIEQMDDAERKMALRALRVGFETSTSSPEAPADLVALAKGAPPPPAPPTRQGRVATHASAAAGRSKRAPNRRR